MSIGDTERATQDRVVSFFKDRDILDYEYLGNLKDAANKNIREDRLRAYLRLSGYSQKLIDGAVSELVKAADDMTHGLYDANHKVYSLLKYGAKVTETADGAPKTVYFMDIETPTNNDFAIAEEVTVVDRQEKRPDIVIYVNGIAMAVIELKKSSVSVSNGIRQNLTNQKDGFIAPFLVGSGDGSYWVLFTYVMILDLGMFGLSIYKKWGELPVICFALTWIVFAGYTYAADLDLMGSVQLTHLLIFSIAFYLIFLSPSLFLFLELFLLFFTS
mgnify:CR=1 FL=1